VRMRVERHELDRLARDMDDAADDIMDKAWWATRASMARITRDAQRQIRSGNYAHLPHLARSFTWDVERDRIRSRIVGEAGAEHERLQGRLDVFIEYGTPTSGEHPHWRPAADREIPRWIRRLERAAGGVFE
jgi:hypothetical protein